MGKQSAVGSWRLAVAKPEPPCVQGRGPAANRQLPTAHWFSTWFTIIAPMVLINKAINEVTVKLVYYGPGLCGKTTNLEKIYGNPKLENKGKMISMATETDRTLFFDFMPMELGTIAGQKVRVQLYTVPGQVFYDATRKLVLRGADGVVFVADSQKSMRESNLVSLENLKTNLRINRIDPDKVAIIFQYNKRDLPTAESVEEPSTESG
jgi:GTPase SAR1 family protein